MRQQMQHRVCRPPRPVIIKIVLWKTACIENAKMRVDARPRIRSRLAAIIKTRPHETTREPWTRGEVTPPALRRVRPAWRIHVVGADVAARFVVLINAARA